MNQKLTASERLQILDHVDPLRVARACRRRCGRRCRGRSGTVSKMNVALGRAGRLSGSAGRRPSELPADVDLVVVLEVGRRRPGEPAGRVGRLEQRGQRRDRAVVQVGGGGPDAVEGRGLVADSSRGRPGGPRRTRSSCSGRPGGRRCPTARAGSVPITSRGRSCWDTGRRAVGAVAPAQVFSKTTCPRSALAASIGNGYFGGSRLLKIRLDVAERRLQLLELLEALLAQQELHVGPDRAGVGAAVVVHRRLAARGATTAGTSSSGRFAPSGSGNVRRERSGLRRLSRTTAISPALIVPRAVFRMNGIERQPPAVGPDQVVEQRSRGRAACCPARRSSCRRSSRRGRPCSRSGCRSSCRPGPLTPAQAHRQAVVGVRGGVQAVAAVERRGVGLGVLLGIGAGSSQNRPTRS